MNSYTYRVGWGFSLERTRGWDRRRFLLRGILPLGLFLVLLLAGGGNRDVLTTPLPAVVIEATTLTHVFLFPRLPQVLGNSFQSFVHLILCKSGLGVPRTRGVPFPFCNFLLAGAESSFALDSFSGPPLRFLPFLGPESCFASEFPLAFSSAWYHS